MSSVPMLRGAYRTRFAPGVVLAGRYRIERPLKSGGMGLLLLGQHLELERPVAIKVLLDTQDNDDDTVARFFREAKAAARLSSEHVVKVYDVGSLDDGMPYIVMELLEGEDLARKLRDRGPLPIPEVAEYLLQACIGLAEAHRSGIVHRDIKPGNIFVTRRKDGRPLVKLVDFGISKLSPTAAQEHQPELTTTSQVMGSPHYMSPEQLKSSREVDARTDIWSLGAVLVRLISGSYAFEGSSDAELCANVLMGQPLPLKQLLPNAPKGLEALVAKCLTRDPAHRMQNVAEFALALAPFLGERGQQLAKEVVGALAPSIPPSPNASSEDLVSEQETAKSHVVAPRSKATFVVVGLLGLFALVSVAVLMRAVFSNDPARPSPESSATVRLITTATSGTPIAETPTATVVVPPIPVIPSSPAIGSAPVPSTTAAPASLPSHSTIGTSVHPRPRPQPAASATSNDFGGRK